MTIDQKCPLCGCSQKINEPELSSLLKLETTDKRVVRCTDCGFRFMNPFLSDKEIEQLYANDSEYFDHHLMMPYIEIVNAKMPYYVETKKLLEQEQPRKGTILDLGCATGHFLSIFKNDGWKVVGVELSDFCRAFARDHFGIDVIKGTVETVDFPPRSFDIISLNHVLEHLREPLEVLERIKKWLKDDGLFCVEVPSEFENIVFALAPFSWKKRLYGSTTPITHHQLFFTPKHLRFALQKTGWTIKSLETWSWESPVPCHLFSSTILNGSAKLVRKSVLWIGSLLEKGDFIRCFSRKA